jgi:hypothetical protein
LERWWRDYETLIKTSVILNGAFEEVSIHDLADMKQQ